MSETDRERLIKLVKQELPRIKGFSYPNIKRLDTALTLIKEYLPDRSSQILDLGCGTGLLDVFLYWEGYCNITAIDGEPSLSSVHDLIQKEFPLDNLKFNIRDMETYEFPKERFDFVFLHDVLCVSKTNFYGLLPKIRESLKGEGLLFFDIWLQEFATPAHILGILLPEFRRYYNFTRYDLKECENVLQEEGFKVLKEAPWFSEELIKGLFQRSIFLFSRRVNARYFVAGKTE